MKIVHSDRRNVIIMLELVKADTVDLSELISGKKNPLNQNFCSNYSSAIVNFTIHLNCISQVKSLSFPPTRKFNPVFSYSTPITLIANYYVLLNKNFIHFPYCNDNDIANKKLCAQIFPDTFPHRWI